VSCITRSGDPATTRTSTSSALRARRASIRYLSRSAISVHGRADPSAGSACLATSFSTSGEVVSRTSSSTRTPIDARASPRHCTSSSRGSSAGLCAQAGSGPNQAGLSGLVGAEVNQSPRAPPSHPPWSPFCDASNFGKESQEPSFQAWLCSRRLLEFSDFNVHVHGCALPANGVPHPAGGV